MWLRDIVEIFFSLGLFINAALFVPQIIRLYKTKNANGLSLMTFGGFNLIQIFILFHGYYHQDYLLMAGYLLSLLTCGTVTIMIIIFRNKY